MEDLKKQRTVLRASFTKKANELEKLLKDKADKQDVQVSWELLVEKSNKLTNLDDEIYCLMLNQTNEEGLLAEMESCEAYKKRYLVLNFQCNEFLDDGAKVQSQAQSVANQSTNSTSSDKGKRKFKLPAIEFKTFDGNIKNWLPFWSQFSKVHDDPEIDLNDKVEYLVQATLPGSRARQLVESFPCVGKNYNEIIDCLTSRFGRDDLQIEVYVRELLKIIVNNALSNGRMDLVELYDSIETQMRALDTLGVKSDSCSAMLFPLIESCLPENLLRVWQRSSLANPSGSQLGSQQSLDGSSKNRLNNLMQFLRNEVDNEQRILLATESFGLRTGLKQKNTNTNIAGAHGMVGARKKVTSFSEQEVPTAAGLINHEKPLVSNKCIFCDNNHDSHSCFKAQHFSPEKRNEIVTAKRACFRCLKIGHQSRKCRARLKCIVCGKSHVALMCSNLPGDKSVDNRSDVKKSNQDSVEMLTCTDGTSSHVFLQTLRVTVRGAYGSRSVRALVDTGSQNTYILKSTADLLGYKSKRQNTINHCLFGGATTQLKHDFYDVKLSYGGYSCTVEALSQPVICFDILPVFEGPWMEELKKLGVQLSDCHDAAPIEILFGSDVAGKLYTGRRHILECGLVATETLLGWTLMGRIPIEKTPNETITAISLFVQDASLTQLWQLDTLGIKDPSEKKSRDQLAQAATEFFLETVNIDEDGRYEVRLPWVEGQPPLPTNYNIAKKRLSNTLNKLKNNDLLNAYNQVFNEWESEHIIEDISTKYSISNDVAHYLPHRAVVKEGSTTRIRPVFDASAKELDAPSLNQCLEKGVNLIELIPNILLRFRQSKIGVVADIRKAFLQISIHEADRNFLRFLWVDSSGHEVVFRHMRVVFGISSSPFLLAATIEYHLAKAIEKCNMEKGPYCKENLEKLSKSFYVDNCVTSVSDDVTLERFIRESSMVMAEAKFDLRGWEFSHQREATDSSQHTGLLGMTWQTGTDMLGISKDCLKDLDKLLVEPVTKRKMLSLAQRIFDPIGFTSPTTLIPKLLLQKIWKMKLTWDANVDSETEKLFHKWLKDLPCLLDIQIPRWIHGGTAEAQHLSFHTFADASQTAYAAVVFVRCVCDDNVFVQLVAAKSRVAPLHELTINRLELMAALISTRLCSSVIEGLGLAVECFYWTDSSTVFSWITRNEAWDTFVYNRVAEIRRHTSVNMWRHVPGTLNPADLPSRGCSAEKLLKSKWWEGPGWLYGSPETWPQGTIQCNEEEIGREKKKKLVTTLINTNTGTTMTFQDWHLSYFSKYFKTIRMIAWIIRFGYNTRNSLNRHQGELTMEEINTAETFVLKIVQTEAFAGIAEKNLSTLNPFKDKDGLIRLKTRISSRDDKEHFRFPVLLPSKHPTVTNIVFDTHVKHCHVGTQGLMSILRENFWILGGRRAIKSVISRCWVCKRHNSKPFQASVVPLPLDRVRDAAVFEVTGVDFAGPLHLKGGEKAWICLFTCAVYRAVHLELCTSLSTTNFMQALRRFIARRGRPRTMYSDNGTNFVGTDNALQRLDWNKIVSESCVDRITWRFNPPTAAWWGGFWERLVGVLKQLLRKTLGRACLSYEELVTVLCDCEMVINSRPLTYVSTDVSEMEPLRPIMFLQDRHENGIPDLDLVDSQSLCRRVTLQKRLREELRRRFRSEYLGQLKSFHKVKPGRDIKLGEIVLIGNDTQKRLDWPLGRVVEFLTGKDNQVRLVKLTTDRGQLLRPIQRLYALECVPHEAPGEHYPDPHETNDAPPECRHSEDCRIENPATGEKSSGGAGVESNSFVPSVTEDAVHVTRGGRAIRKPRRFL